MSDSNNQGSGVSSKGILDEQVSRMASAFKELDDLEGRALARASQAVEEAARLTNETMAYVARLGSEWRKLAVGVAQRAAEIAAPRG